MELTTDLLAAFVGGQSEMQDLANQQIRWGQIETIALDGDQLVLRYRWVANGVGWIHPNVDRWVNDPDPDHLEYRRQFVPGFVGEAKGSRLFITFQALSELLILHRPTGRRLDWSQVEEQ